VGAVYPVFVKVKAALKAASGRESIDGYRYEAD
jgi:hypothetical protein